jgi:hypothetical protein
MEVLIKRESQSYLASSTRNLIPTPPSPEKPSKNFSPEQFFRGKAKAVMYSWRIILHKFDYECNLKKY